MLFRLVQLCPFQASTLVGLTASKGLACVHFCYRVYALLACWFAFVPEALNIEVSDATGGIMNAST